MKSFLSFYLRHRKLSLGIVLITVAAAALYIFPETALAVDTPSAAPAGNDSLMKSVNDSIFLIMRVTSAWLWPIIMMIGSLLDNDLIFGGAMGDRLLSIWVQIRNIVNIIFVLVLLAIAVYNVIPGIGEDSGGMGLGLKQALPKFVLALVAVNFSFLAIKVVLDFTNVITGAVFALPGIETSDNLSEEVANTICGTASKEVPMKSLWCENKKLTARAEAFFSRLDRSNITIAYALRFGKAVDLKFIRGGLKDLSQLAFNVIFNAVLYVVYAISYIVLFLVLLMRLVSMWLAVVLSPLLALGIVLPNLKDLAGGAGDIKERFMADALAPMKIGLVLSVGYIMLDGLQIDKTLSGGILSGSTLQAVDPNAIPTDINDLQQLMIAVAVVVILWKGVFSAADKTSASGITNFIKDHMESFGGWVAKLPTLAPIIPIGSGTDRRSLAQVLDVLNLKKEQMDYKFGRAPERDSADQSMQLGKLNRAAEGSDLPSYIAALKPNISILTNPDAVGSLETIAKNVGDPNLAAALHNVDKKDTKAVVRAIRNVGQQNSKVLRELHKGGIDIDDIETATKNAAEAAAKTEAKKETPAPAATPPAPTAPPAAPPIVATSGDEVVGILQNGAPEVLAAKGSFEGWSPGDVQKLKEALPRLSPERLRSAVIKLEKGKVDHRVISEDWITKAATLAAKLGAAGITAKDALIAVNDSQISDAKIKQNIVEALNISQEIKNAILPSITTTKTP